MKLFLFILILSFSHIAISTEKMVLEFPNGKKFGCESCHYTKKKSNPLNVFGQDVKNIGLENDLVNWSALYKKDSDCDGFTNGEELGDPLGTWEFGEADPEPDTPITKPWDPMDYPCSLNSDIYFSNVFTYPNPFFDMMTISYLLKYSGYILVKVFDVNGKVIKTLSEKYVLSGVVEIDWDGTDAKGDKLPCGIYSISIANTNAFVTVSVVLE